MINSALAAHAKIGFIHICPSFDPFTAIFIAYAGDFLCYVLCMKPFLSFLVPKLEFDPTLIEYILCALGTLVVTKKRIKK